MRKPKYKPEVSPAAAQVVERLENVTAELTPFYKWLLTVACTSPFTIADAAELKAMIKHMLGSHALVDVYTTRGGKAFVRVQIGSTIIERVLDVV